jgi:D-alanyl-D-alanine carboxypeptidase
VRRLFIALQILALSVIPTYAQEADNTNPALDLVWDQIHAQPDDFSAACMPLANRAGTTLYNADALFPLASVSKLIIFIEYARRVDAGLIPLDEMVRLDALNIYDVPRSNSDAHERFLDQYASGIQTISLWDVASQGMIQYSSNAASDFLLDRLGPTDWDSLFQILKVTDMGYPHSMGAIALLMTNHETGRAVSSEIPTFSISQGEALFDLYLGDTGWHQAEVAYRSEQHRLFPGWEVQAALLDYITAKGTASDFLNVLAAIYDTGGPLSERTKQLVRDALRWRNNDYVDVMYREYGSKLGFYSGGVLALVAYGEPYTGNPVVSVAFLRNIPRRVYNQMLHQDSIGELAHWMNLNACAGLLDALTAVPLREN